MLPLKKDHRRFRNFTTSSVIYFAGHNKSEYWSTLFRATWGSSFSRELVPLLGDLTRTQLLQWQWFSQHRVAVTDPSALESGVLTKDPSSIKATPAFVNDGEWKIWSDNFLSSTWSKLCNIVFGKHLRYSAKITDLFNTMGITQSPILEDILHLSITKGVTRSPTIKTYWTYGYHPVTNIQDTGVGDIAG